MATVMIEENDARIQLTIDATGNVADVTQFTIDFPFFDEDDINVIITDGQGNDTSLARGTGTGTYAVVGAVVEDGFSGGYITLGDVYQDVTVTIFRDVVVARTTDFATSGPFNISALNTELDKIYTVLQENRTRSLQALSAPQSDGIQSLELPTKEKRKGQFLFFDPVTGIPAPGGDPADIATIGDLTEHFPIIAPISAEIVKVSEIADEVVEVAGFGQSLVNNLETFNSVNVNLDAILEAEQNAIDAALSEASATASASAAATSASSASSDAIDVANTLAGAEALVTQVQQRFLGTHAVAPTTDNEGAPLVIGAHYFNTTDNIFYTWDGIVWIPSVVPNPQFHLDYYYIITAPQLPIDTITGADNNGNILEIGNGVVTLHRNGLKIPPEDYSVDTVTNSVIFLNTNEDTDLKVNDVIDIRVTRPFAVADIVSAGHGGSFRGPVIFESLGIFQSTATFQGAADFNDDVIFESDVTFGTTNPITIDTDSNTILVGLAATLSDNRSLVIGGVANTPTGIQLDVGTGTGSANISMGNITLRSSLDATNNPILDFQVTTTGTDTPLRIEPQALCLNPAAGLDEDHIRLTSTGKLTVRSQSGDPLLVNRLDATTPKTLVQFQAGSDVSHQIGYIFGSRNLGTTYRTVQESTGVQMAPTGFTDTAGVEISQWSQLPATPVGSVIDYAGTSAPAGWIFCAGQSVLVSNFPALFAAIGYGYGGAGPSFNVPDLRGRVVAGENSMGQGSTSRLTGNVNGDAIGSTGGSSSVVLNSSQMPAHSHSGSTSDAGSHSHLVSFNIPAQQEQVLDVLPRAGLFREVNQAQRTPVNVLLQSAAPGNSVSTQPDHAHSLNVDTAGGSAAHNNIQPTMVLNKIIRAF